MPFSIYRLTIKSVLLFLNSLPSAYHIQDYSSAYSLIILFPSFYSCSYSSYSSSMLILGYKTACYSRAILLSRNGNANPMKVSSCSILSTN